MTEAERVYQEYKQLPEEERMRFHELILIEDEENGGFATPEIEAAWNQEIGRRLADFESGEVQAISAEEYKRNRRPLS